MSHKNLSFQKMYGEFPELHKFLWAADPPTSQFTQVLETLSVSRSDGFQNRDLTVYPFV